MTRYWGLVGRATTVYKYGLMNLLRHKSENLKNSRYPGRGVAVPLEARMPVFSEYMLCCSLVALQQLERADWPELTRILCGVSIQVNFLTLAAE